ncbi:MAG: Na+/H+ antiporter NhaA [Enterobacteriaceae bacterium]
MTYRYLSWRRGCSNCGTVVLNLCGVCTGVYILVGVLWTAVLKSGFTQPLAGVIVGFFIPLKRSMGALRLNVWSMLHPWVAYLICRCLHLLMLAFHCKVSRWKV